MNSKVIFVGLHNKPMKMPLCSSTKSGKLIDRIISKCKSIGVTTQKTNLYDIDNVPYPGEGEYLEVEWWRRIEPKETDIIVLLGAMVHNNFAYMAHENVIKVAHPASKRSHVEMNDYVEKTFELILAKIQKSEQPTHSGKLDSNPKAFT